jgi:DNA-binding IclR family transcriptional regulator
MPRSTTIDSPTASVPHAPKAIRAKEDRHFVTALARGLDVLGAFRSRDRTLGNQELARRCGLPKSTISRLTYTLTKQGYLEHAQDGNGNAGYRLGSAVLALGSAMLARMDMRQIARPLMQELADSSQAMVSLGIRDRLSMIYVENCRSESALIPLGTTAMGRAYMAVCGDAERQTLMEGMRRLDEKNWPQTRAELDMSLAHYRKHGCCSSFGEWQKDVNAIAMGFMPASGRALMVVNCGGPGVNLSPQFLMSQVRPQLAALVNKLQNASG